MQQPEGENKQEEQIEIPTDVILDLDETIKATMKM